MNRKQKIIVSITGIFIILLALVGLTYAYFLTRITGNENDKSISVTTANLELVYGDGNNLVTAANIEPGDPITPKTFTVTNNGNATVEGFNIYLEDVRNSLSRKTDMIYTITCVNTTEGATSTTCEDFEVVENEVNGTEFVFPSVMSIIARDTLEPATETTNAEEHTYTITLTYKEMNIDQSEDMNKEVSAKVNIYDNKTKFLASEIINNARNEKNGTMFIETPISKVAEEISLTKGTGKYGLQEIPKDLMPIGYAPWLVADSESGAINGSEVSNCEDVLAKGGYIYDRSNRISSVIHVESCSDNGNPISMFEIMDYEKELSTTLDDYGTSYYFRGNIIDNYVNFAGMCWRIVRIEGDGSTKLILEDQNVTCNDELYTGNWNIKQGNFGYDSTSGKIKLNYLEPKTNADKSMIKAFYDFQNMFTIEEKLKLKAGDWCLNDIAYKPNNTSLNKYTLIDKNIDRYSLDNFYYDSYVRLTSPDEKGYQPTLKCNGTVMDKFKSVIYEGNEIIIETPMYVGTLTADEVAYAGTKADYSSLNFNFYLMNDYSSDTFNFRTLSPKSHQVSGLEFAYDLYNRGILGYSDITGNSPLRPAVKLNSSVNISSGEGTIVNPYVIE